MGSNFITFHLTMLATYSTQTGEVDFNRISSLETGRASIRLKGLSKPSPLLILPSELVCRILSFLDARSLSRLARTCWAMEKISSDSLLWRKLLQKDTREWSVIGHLSHPQVYLDAASDLHPKIVYSQCYKNRRCVPMGSFTSPVTMKLKWLLRRLQGSIPKVLVFGSGLESLPFVRKLMWEGSSPYKPVGLVPGKDGIGSGFCVEHFDGSPINLVTLYRAVKAERQRATGVASTNPINRLMASSSEGCSRPQLISAVSELCRHADAFLLVIDARNGANSETDGCVVDAMLKSAHLQTPLLVANVITKDTDCSTPIKVADQLELCKLANHPWQVRNITLETFEGLQQGLHWLLGKD